MDMIFLNLSYSYTILTTSWYFSHKNLFQNNTLPPRYSQYEQHEAVDVPSLIAGQEPVRPAATTAAVPVEEPVLPFDDPSAMVARTSPPPVPEHDPSASVDIHNN